MTIFVTALNQMLLMAVFMLAGYFMRRKSLLPEETTVTLSKLQNFVVLPCVIMNSFITRCTVENMASKGKVLLWGCLTVLIAIVISTIVSQFFSKEHDIKGIYMYSLAVANIAYVGNPPVETVFGSDMLFDYLIFCIPFTIAIYSWGVSVMTPVKEGEKSGDFKAAVIRTLKHLMSPTFIAMIIGIAIGLSGIKMPSFILKAISAGAGSMVPTAMILIGFIVGGFDLGKLLASPKVYIASLLRLVVIPLVIYSIAKLAGADDTILVLVLTATCMPLGTYSIIYPASYGGDTSTGAGMVLVSHVLSLATIPLMYMFLV